MKITKICPKCQGNDILFIEGSIGAYGAGNNIPTSTFRYAKVGRYVCCTCGYSEEWIDREDMEKLKKKYRKTND